MVKLVRREGGKDKAVGGEETSGNKDRKVAASVTGLYIDCTDELPLVVEFSWNTESRTIDFHFEFGGICQG